MKTYVFQRIVNNFMLWLPKRNKNSVILNVGCGPGWLEKAIWSKLNGEHIVSMDISPEMARLTKSRTPQLDVVVADAENLPFRTGAFDALFSGRAIKFLHIQKFLNQTSLVLKDHGSLGIIFDCADAVWLRILERIGKRMDAGIGERTLRASDLSAELREGNFEVTKTVQISLLPYSIFSLPAALHKFLSLIDIPVVQSRLTFICGRLKEKQSSYHGTTKLLVSNECRIEIKT